jgi:Transcription termination factor
MENSIPESVLRKNAARLVFVQALYGEHFDISIESAESWVARYNEDLLTDQAVESLEEDEHSEELFELKPETLPDMQFLRKCLRGWLQEQAAVRRVVDGVLNDKEKRPLERLSPLIQSILCAAAFEMVHLSTKTPVILKEYVEIASGFFDNPELGFINGMLQELATQQSS